MLKRTAADFRLRLHDAKARGEKLIRVDRFAMEHPQYGGPCSVLNVSEDSYTLMRHSIDKPITGSLGWHEFECDNGGDRWVLRSLTKPDSVWVSIVYEFSVGTISTGF